tara:strand:+ start:10919 stop:11938 length:1020 start_codon:yes stop_codon:yes gene_type:complete
MSADALTTAHLQRATEQLDDLANRGMDSVPNNFRAVISTFAGYDVGIKRVVDSLNKAVDASRDSALADIRQAFVASIGAITRSGGIHLTQDKSAPALGSFIVPGLGITIVPLVYGEHHSWNLAYLNDEHRDVPNHLHHFGAEIHLGFEPLEGYMVLGDAKSFVKEGYALPIPPETRHGWINRGPAIHHVPFIFGSLKHAGWGVFADVVPQPIHLDKLVETDRDSWKMGTPVYLEREILAASRSSSSRRSVIIPASVTDRDGSGGLELAVSRVSWGGMYYLNDSFRIVSVVKGNGRVRIGSLEENLAPHDHFGIPSGLEAHIEQVGDEPLTLLDAVLRER